MPPKQADLFGDTHPPAPTPTISGGSGTVPLTRNQRRFNRLTARLQQLHAEVSSWRDTADRFRQRALSELEPLRRRLFVEQRDAALFLDKLLTGQATGNRLTRSRRRKLAALVGQLCLTLLHDGEDEEIQAIFDRHSGMRHSDVRREELEFTEVMLGAMFGDDLMRGHSASDVEELLNQAGERLDARAEAQGARAQAQSRAPRSKQRDQRQEASRSMREVFRRLAGALHPDREADPVERERKTALMQRVNRAYESNDLLELLTVQLEIEQIDSDHLAKASDERLGHYCAVLREQEIALEREMFELQAPFRAALDLDPGRNAAGLRPEALDVLFSREIKSMREALAQLRADMEGFRDPERRNAMIDRIELDRELDAFTALAVQAFDAAPVRKRKRKGRRKR